MDWDELLDGVILGDAAITRFQNAEGVYVITDVQENDGSGAGSPDAAGGGGARPPGMSPQVLGG